MNSGERLRTDAPVDHTCKAQNFTHTDLFASAVETYFLTLIGITAKEKEWKLDEVSVEVEILLAR